jgi:hypothetical protein
MRTKVFGSMLLAAAACLAAVPVFGQKADNKVTVADQYVISAEAGAVNYAEGEVTVSRFDGTGGMIIKGDRAKVGDKIHTGKGWAEILLNPGSYLRMGRDTTFQFRSTSLDDLRVRLEKGSAIFEVLATAEFRVSVFTPKNRIVIAQSGVYRVDLAADGTGTLSVTKGRAVVGDKDLYVVKEGRTATLDGRSTAVAKFDKDDMDDLAVWSKDRAKQLGNIAKSFKQKDLRNSLLGSMSLRRGFGRWVFDPRLGLFCFVPYFDVWDSPYGWRYRRGFYDYNPYYNPYGNTSNNNNGGGYYPPPAASSGDVKSIPAPPPPPVYTTRESAPPKKDNN